MANKKSQKSKSAPPSTRKAARTTTPVKMVAAPVAISRRTNTVKAKPKTSNMPYRSQLLTRVTNSDDLRVNNGFVDVQKFRLNPSNQNVFPSLAFEAANYDEYRFTYLRLRYQSFCGTATNGKVELCYDPDSQDSLPASAAVLSQYAMQASCSAWDKCEILVTRKGPTPWRFIDDTNVVDKKLVDSGQAIIATYASGPSGANLQIGDWYIDYRVEFRSPQPTASLVQTGIIDVGGGLTTRGATYVSSSDIGYTATTFSMYVNIPGTFLVHLYQVGSGSLGAVVAGNSSIDGAFKNVVATSNNSSNTFCVLTSTGVPSTTPSIQLSAMTASSRVQFTIVRCRAVNGFA